MLPNGRGHIKINNHHDDYSITDLLIYTIQ